MSSAGLVRDPWLFIGCLACVPGLVLAVRRRFGAASRLSWLDAAMCDSSVAALAAALGARGPAIVAAGGVAGALALSRWRPSRTVLLGAAGLALLGAGLVIPALPVLLIAALWREPRAQPGPEFSWTVLVATVALALAALALLIAGQFARVGVVAVVLATLAVLVGTARAAVTITERLRESERQAVTDVLTGLTNRRHLIDRLNSAIAEAKTSGTPIALLLIDLDGFKELNDTLGHYAGDEVLRQIGPRLRALLRRDDTLARLGGDEFAVALVPGDEASASSAALRMRAALERSFEVADIAVHVDASVGIALFPDHAEDAPGLLQRADVAMYEAKRIRSGHEVYVAARDRHSRQRLALIGELRTAIDAGQLHLEYQPIAELATGTVRGVEALVRWAHPTLGRVAPAQFLPLAEQSGLTRALTEFVLDRALEQIGACRASGFDVRVSVNLGPADLLDRGLPLEVSRVLEARDFPAEALELEVSENVVMTDPDRTIDVLARLRDVGVGISLDDFGAGHSSLAHLKQLRVDELKIDCAFVFRMADDARDAAIVVSTIDLAHRLGLRAVAEGVESQATWDLLAECGCDYAQGNFLMPPLPDDSLTAWLRGIREESAVRAGDHPWLVNRL
ncbi:MAG: bifunctional diguanylate cyclase/phosphodiesterase [Solirubrobacterales bacterium]|nr:bifunctional diguanylate cyclase/phosphodiesterase [Solirubrobacterales bacterium]MBV9717061.1 bifunctional diguanylate cyclase/phosphodiesterase [Solirubrobacterales bacterium]